MDSNVNRAAIGTSPGPDAIPNHTMSERIIAQLPSSVRWVTLLAVVEGLSPAEIATLAGVKIDVVVDVLNRGKALAENIHHELVAENMGGSHGNHRGPCHSV